MEKSINSLRPVHIICYAIGVVCLILLFFANGWEPAFFEWMNHNPISLIYGLTVSKILLFLLDVGMFISIRAPLKNEDERVEKIKNYVFVHTFIAALATGIILGLFMKIATSLLLYIAITQAYYILIFQLCLYRDSLMIYMNKEQLEAYGLETNKRFKAEIYILPLLTAVIVNFCIMNHRYDIMFIAVTGVVYLYAVIRSVYMHWKK